MIYFTRSNLGEAIKLDGISSYGCRALEKVEVVVDKDHSTPENVGVLADDE